MGAGIRAEVRIDEPANCPIADVSGRVDAPVHSVSKSAPPGEPGTVTEEFAIDADTDPDDDAFEPVFAYEGKQVYRFTHEAGWGCPCESVEQFDCPVVDVRTADGALYLTFHAHDLEQLQEIATHLRDRYRQVEIRRLVRSTEDATEESLALVDRTDLTERQREVLETAHELGYFEHPKGANAGEVADELGISRSTFSEHIAAAQTKIMAAIVDA